MCAANNHIILKFRIRMSKSALESGNLAEIFIAIWKSCRNLRWNLEIFLDILKSYMKSWNLHEFNLEIFPEILSEIPRFQNLVQNFFQWSTPRLVLLTFFTIEIDFSNGRFWFKKKTTCALFDFAIPWTRNRLLSLCDLSANNSVNNNDSFTKSPAI